MAIRRRFPIQALLVAVLALAAGVAAYAAAKRLGDPAPLGVVLPDVPQLYEIIPRDELNQTSVVQGRMPAILLEQLAQQPDGASPLKFHYRCDFGDFSIGHPYAASASSPGPEQAVDTGILLKGEFLYDQPIKKIMYTIPFRHEGESVPTFVSRTRFELEKDGAKFYADVKPLGLDGYRFEHYEYDQELKDGSIVSHFVFIGPFGNIRVLSLDFMTTPELHNLARPLVWKMVRSFTAGWDLKQGAEKFDSEYLARNELDTDAAGG